MAEIKVAIAEKNGKLCTGDILDADRILFYSVDLEKNIIKFEKEEPNPVKNGDGKKFLESILRHVKFIASGTVSEELKKLKEKNGITPIAVQSTDNINIALARIADTVKDGEENQLKLNRDFYLLI